jgi:hypothetical protein
VGVERSPFQHIDIFDVDRLTIPVKGNHQGKTNGCLGSGDCHYKEDEDLAVYIL